MSVSLRCSDCGTANPAEAHFCGNCGASLSTAVEVAPAPELDAAAVRAALSTSATPQQSAPAQCRQCGHENPPDALFCANCGSSLAVAETSPPPSAAAVRRTAAAAALTAGVEYAGFWRRAAAWLIDTVVLWVGQVMLYSPLVDAVLWVSGSYGLATVSTYLPSALYGVLFIAFRGQTPGKMLLHVRVVNEYGAVPGFWRAALRETLGKWVSALAVGYGFLSVAWNGKKRGWHDIVAGTYVIKAS